MEQRYYASWQQPRYFGKHEKWIPCPPMPMPNGYVHREIPVEGTVTSAPDYSRSPQLAYWIAPKKPGLLKRFLAWLEK